MEDFLNMKLLLLILPFLIHVVPVRSVPALRLVNGNNAYEGRLDIYFNNQWNMICDDRWTALASRVACRQLGYQGGSVASKNTFAYDLNLEIFLDDVECTGTEASVAQCPHREWGMHNCNKDEAVGIRCEAPTCKSVCLPDFYSYVTPSITCPHVSECYTDDPKATDYRGFVSVTQSGLTCQEWAATSPHFSIYTPDDPNDQVKGIGDHNFCRNPDNSPNGAWCYTTDPNSPWQHCDIGEPQASCGDAITLSSGLTRQSSDQSSIATSSKAVDGNTNGAYTVGSCTHTMVGQASPWWMVDLGSSQCVSKVELYNRNDCCGTRLTGAIVRVGPDSNRNNPACGVVTSAQVTANQKIELSCGYSGRYLSVHGSSTTQALSLCEVKAYSGICSNSASGACCLRCLDGEDCIIVSHGSEAPLGMEDGRIEDSQITVSGYTYSYFGSKGRLNGESFWSASTRAPIYMQIDFRKLQGVTGIQTQGATGPAQYVKTVNIAWGLSTDSLNTIMENGAAKVFQASTDKDTVATIPLPETVLTRYLRVTIVSWNWWPAFRMEVLGYDCSDVEPPIISGLPDDVAEYANPGESIPLTWAEPTVTDNVDSSDSLLYSLTQSHSSGFNFPIGETYVVFSATDEAGNTGVASFSVNILEACSITCTGPECILLNPSNLTVNPLGFENGIIRDAQITGSQQNYAHTPSKARLNTDSYFSGSTGASPIYVQVDFLTPVVVAGVQTQGNDDRQWVKKFKISTGLSADALITIKADNGLDQFFDGNTDADGVVTTMFPYGAHIVAQYLRLTITSYEWIPSLRMEALGYLCPVTTEDITPPEIFGCPADIYTDFNSIVWAAPTATDDSGSVTLLSASHDPNDNNFGFPDGKTTVTYTFEDSAGNSAVCSFDVYYSPGLKSATSTLTLDATYNDALADPNSAEFRELANQFEEEMNMVMSEYVDNRYVAGVQVTSFSAGSIVVTYQIYLAQTYPNILNDINDDIKQDIADGNLGALTVNPVVPDITGNDVTPPQIGNCPNDLTRWVFTNQFGTQVYWAEPSPRDDFTSEENIVVAQTHASNDVFTLGVTSVTYMFTDEAGNSASCSFLVIVNQIVPTTPAPGPVSSTLSVSLDEPWDPAFLNVNSPEYQALKTQVTNELTAELTAELGADLISVAVLSFSEGSIVVTFMVTVEGPMLQSKKTEIQNAVETAVSDGSLGSFVAIADSAKAGVTPPPDIYPPVITGCPDDITIRLSQNQVATPVYWNEPNATDNAGYVRLDGRTHVPNSIFTVGYTLVTYSYRDGSANTATCSFYVVIQAWYPTTPPPAPVTSQLSVSLDREYTSALANPTSPEYIALENEFISNMNGVMMEKLGAEFVGVEVLGFSPGSILVTFSVSVTGPYSQQKLDMLNMAVEGAVMDGSLSALGVEGSVVVGATLPPDVTPPIIGGCPNNTYVDLEYLVPTATVTPIPGVPVTWTEPIAYEPSGEPVILTYRSHNPGRWFYRGTTMVTYTFTDQAGNSASCEFEVIVAETFVRTYTGSLDQEFNEDLANPDSTAFITLATEFEDEMTKYLTAEFGDDFKSVAVKGFMSGSVQVTFTVTARGPVDGGKISSLQAAVDRSFTSDTLGALPIISDSIETDHLPPKISNCPNDTTIFVDPGVPSARVNWTEPTATDISGVAELINYQRYYSGLFFPVGTTDIQYVFQDLDGNRATCSFSIVVSDVSQTVSSVTLDMEFTPALADPNSAESKALATQFEEEMAAALAAQLGSEFVDVEVTGFSAGSVVVTFVVYLSGPSTPEDLAKVTTALREAVTSGSLGSLSVDPDSVVVKVVERFEACSVQVRELAEAQVLFYHTPHHPMVFSADALPQNCFTTFKAPVGKKIYIRYVDVILGVADRVNLRIYDYGANFHTYASVTNKFARAVYEVELSYYESYLDNIDTTGFEVGDMLGQKMIEKPNILTKGNEVSVSLYAYKYGTIPDAGFALYDKLKVALELSVLDSADSLPKGQFLCPNNGFEIISNLSDTSMCEDKTPPVVDGLCDQTVTGQAYHPQVQAVVNYVEPTATDDSGDPVVIYNYGGSSGGFFRVGQSVVTYYIYDSNYNNIRCQVTVIVELVYPTTAAPDIIPPTIATFIQTIVRTANPLEPRVTVYWDERDIIASDNDGFPPLLTSSNRPGERFNIGTNIVTYQARDRSGNTATVAFEIIILDCGDRFITLEPGKKAVLNSIGGYPKYAANADCRYTVRTQIPGSLIKIDFVTFQISGEDDLILQWLSPNFESTLLNPKSPPSNMVADTREINVIFRTDAENELEGYQIVFQMVQQIKLNPNQIAPIRSPLGVTANYDDDLFVEVHIKSPVFGFKIVFNIQKLDIDSGDDELVIGWGDIATDVSTIVFRDSQITSGLMYVVDNDIAYLAFTSGPDGRAGSGYLVEVFAASDEEIVVCGETSQVITPLQVCNEVENCLDVNLINLVGFISEIVVCGETSQVITPLQVCNEVENCMDSSDEVDCPALNAAGSLGLAQEFTDDLNDPNSEGFQNLANSVSSSMDGALSQQYGDAYGGTEVTSLTSGSVVVGFTTMFTAIPFANVSDDMDIGALTQMSLSNAIEMAANSSEGGLDLPVIPGSAEVKEVVMPKPPSVCDNLNISLTMGESVDIVSGNFPGYSTGYPSCVVVVDAPGGERVYANFMAAEFGDTDNAILIASDDYVFGRGNETGKAMVDMDDEYPLDVVSIGNRLIFNFTSFDVEAEYRISIRVSVLNASIIANGTEFCNNEIQFVDSEYVCDDIPQCSDGKDEWTCYCGDETEFIVSEDILNTTELNSPRYPQDYPVFTDCSYFVSSPSGEPFVVRFESFNVEDGSDYLYISPADGSGSLTSYTGSTVPSTYRSEGEDLEIRFYADGDGAARGYQLILSLADMVPPEIYNLPNDTEVDNSPGKGYAVVEWTEPDITDNGDSYTVTKSHESGDQFPTGDTEVVYTVVDDGGNKVNASFIVTVKDVEPPYFDPRLEDIVLSLDGMPDRVVTWEVTAKDNADDDDLTVTSNYNSGDSFEAGTTLVSVTVTDAFGNMASSSFNVIISANDNAPPVFVNSTIEDFDFIIEEWETNVTVYWDTPNATDPSGEVTITSTHKPGDMFYVGLTRVVYTAVDLSGNNVTLEFDVNVQVRTFPPVSVDGEMTINHYFHGYLNDPTSDGYKKLKKQVEQPMNEIFSNEFGDAFKNVLVNAFRKGSVVAEFTVNFNQPVDKRADDPMAATRELLTSTLKDAVSGGRLGSISVKPDSISTIDVALQGEAVILKIKYKKRFYGGFVGFVDIIPEEITDGWSLVFRFNQGLHDFKLTGCNAHVDYISPNSATYVVINDPSTAYLPAGKRYRITIHGKIPPERRQIGSMVEFYASRDMGNDEPEEE